MATSLLSSVPLDAARISVLRAEWQLVSGNFQVAAPGAAAIAKALPKEPGTYLWVASTGSAEYCLYVGKCKNFANRMYAYTQSFQPHAPNDRKLAFSQAAVLELFEETRFVLYFKPCDESKIDKMETSAIAAFEPILNNRLPRSAETRMEFEAMYQAFYRRLLGRVFGEA